MWPDKNRTSAEYKHFCRIYSAAPNVRRICRIYTRIFGAEWYFTLPDNWLPELRLRYNCRLFIHCNLRDAIWWLTAVKLGILHFSGRYFFFYLNRFFISFFHLNAKLRDNNDGITLEIVFYAVFCKIKEKIG